MSSVLWIVSTKTRRTLFSFVELFGSVGQLLDGFGRCRTIFSDGLLLRIACAKEEEKRTANSSRCGVVSGPEGRRCLHAEGRKPQQGHRVRRGWLFRRLGLPPRLSWKLKNPGSVRTSKEISQSCELSILFVGFFQLMETHFSCYIGSRGSGGEKKSGQSRKPCRS